MTETTINDLARAYREMKRERDRAREQRDHMEKFSNAVMSKAIMRYSRWRREYRQMERQRNEARRWARKMKRERDAVKTWLKLERLSHESTWHEWVRDHKEVVAQRDAARAEVDSIRAALNAYGPPGSDKSGRNLAALARMYREFTEARLGEGE